jgi:hypothetical protein
MNIFLFFVAYYVKFDVFFFFFLKQMKYELVEATKSCHIIEGEGWYVHVNFIARAVDSPDQLFFAEVRHEDEIKVLTCFCCLQEHEQVGQHLSLS